MANFNVGPIDLSKLEAQLRLAIEEDEKYKREDAAKFRAIEQSKTYEEFRNIVKASHLKPLDKHESLCPRDMKPASWNIRAGKNLRAPSFERVTSAISTCASDTGQKLDEILGKELGYEKFHELWLLCSEDLEGRLKLLEKAFLVDKIFKGHDLSVDLISEIMGTLNESLNQDLKNSNEAYDFVIKVMMSVCSTPRFSLHMLLLSETERSVIDQLKEKVKVYSVEVSEKGEAPRDDASVSLAFLDCF
ncbi:dynein axonemal assembly factor 19 [Hetaerina americana]|uniref:dynein axonemal assembly factor 19 n=1 Tax=Hetaerina americana TaxID=62018 RepID=UPI003A7F5587